MNTFKGLVVDGPLRGHVCESEEPIFNYPQLSSDLMRAPARDVPLVEPVARIRYHHHPLAYALTETAAVWSIERCDPETGNFRVLKKLVAMATVNEANARKEKDNGNR
jgi:hypothetical protein